MEKELAAAGVSHCAAPFVDDVLMWADSFDDLLASLQKMLQHLQKEYRFSLVHKPGSSNPADVPSREANNCLADITGARLDLDQVDWPLPRVLLPNLECDSTVYDHDDLARQLGITPAVSTAAAPSSAMVALAAAAVTMDETYGQVDFCPAQLLQAAVPEAALTLPQLEHEALQALLCSNNTAVDQMIPTGVVLYEPFGGLCAGLEMALRNGLTIAQYIYSDTDPVAQTAACHRIRMLQTMYPQQLSERAVQGCFAILPMDVQQYVKRAPDRTVQLAMGPGRLAQPVARADAAPAFGCNVPGQPRAAWPTLMSRPQSYAFRPGQPGSVLDVTEPAAPKWVEPTAEEREAALGYLPGSTAARGLSCKQRCVNHPVKV